MKNETIPFPREFRPGDAGPDVHAVKNALADAGGRQGMTLSSGAFGGPAQAALVAFKKQHGLLDDPIYTAQAHAALLPHFNDAGGAQMVEVQLAIAGDEQRAAFLAELHWMLAHRSQFTYEQLRPIPHEHDRRTSQPIVTDCSGSIAIAACWAGVPHPSRLGCSGWDNTGTFLADCQRLQRTQVVPGDLIVYRRNTADTYGHHAVAVVDLLDHFDCRVFSHGHQGDPETTTHSAMAASQAADGYPMSTFLRFLNPGTAKLAGWHWTQPV